MLRGIFLLVAHAVFSGQASAHTGDHGTYNALEAIHHFIAEPTHMVAAVALGALIVWFLSAKRRKKD